MWKACSRGTSQVKKRINSASYHFEQTVLRRESKNAAGSSANFSLSSEEDTEAVLACDLQMEKFIPHWRQTAQLGKTCYCQKIHHIFVIADSSNYQNHSYVVDETVAGDIDS